MVDYESAARAAWGLVGTIVSFADEALVGAYLVLAAINWTAPYLYISPEMVNILGYLFPATVIVMLAKRKEAPTKLKAK